MLNEEIKSVLVNHQQRKIISTLQDCAYLEENFSHESDWRQNHQQQHFRKEIMLQLTGSHSVSLNGKTYRSSPNTLLMINSRETHDERYYPENEDSSHLWFFIGRERITCQCDEVKNGKFHILFQYLYENREKNKIPDEYSGKIKKLNRIWDSASGGTTAPDTVLFGISVILNEILWNILEEETHLFVQGNNSRESAIEKAKNYIDNTCGRGCNLAFLAELAGYSVMHFQRLFKKYTGMNVSTYISRKRLLRYEEMRRYFPLKAIAEELGFSSASALSHFLKKAFIFRKEDDYSSAGREAEEKRDALFPIRVDGFRGNGQCGPNGRLP